MCIENYMKIIYIFPFDLSSPEQILWKRLGLHRILLKNDASRGVFTQTSKMELFA